MLNEENIEKFIRDNKEEFEGFIPPVSHLEKFLVKLNFKIKHIINIAPYLIRLSIVTIIIFASSIIIWNNYIRKDRDEKTLKNKISTLIDKTRVFEN